MNKILHKSKEIIETVKLEDICHLITDGKHGDCQNEDNSGYYFLSAKDVRDGKLNYENARQITYDDFVQTHKRTQLESLDILISNSGTIGRMAIAKNNELTRRTTFQKSVAIVKPIKDKVSSFWLYYYLLNNTERLINTAGGTAQKNLLLRDMRAFKVDIPPLQFQKKIAFILTAYDDLIENNNRRIKILEEMAQAIYREWFVNFRFPGYEKIEMVKSELGMIPEGWEVKKLGDVCDVVMGQSPKSEYYNTDGEGLPFHQGVKDYGSRFPTHSTYCTVEGRIAEQRDILISVRAPVGRINLANTKLIIGRGLSAVRHKQGLQSFLLYQLKDIFSEEDSMGSGTIYKAITKTDLLGLKLKHPSAGLDKHFNELVTPMDSEIENLTLKVNSLRKTRDLLLPKLISGEIDVVKIKMIENKI